MRRIRYRETVTVGGGAPAPDPTARPMAVIVHEGDPERAELAPRPESHSPTEVQHARSALLGRIRVGPPTTAEGIADRIAADRVGMARAVAERDGREAEVAADRARRRGTR
jgi:hypothetical protein